MPGNPINDGAPLIDLIMNTGNDETWKFTVNNLVTDVAMVAPANDGLLSRADFKELFQEADHFQILSLGCVLQLGFQFWENDVAASFRGPKLSLNAKIGGGGLTAIEPSTIWLPYENYELNLGSYDNLNTTVFTSTFSLHLSFDTGQGQNVSMVGVPDVLNGEVFRCPLYMKVLHTLPMIAA